MGNNEIVFPENPDVLRAGASTNRYTLVFSRIEVGEQSDWPGVLASSGDLTLLVNRMGAFHVLDGDRFAPGGLPDFRPPEPADGREVTLRRILDVALRRQGAGWDLFLSFAYEGPRPGCTSVAVARAAVTQSMLEGQGAPGWKTIFTSQPCIDGAGNQISLLGGGAMLLEGDRLTIGIGTFSLMLPDPSETIAFLQSDETGYGKVFEIDLKSNAATILSRGHRDPVGLVRTPDGALWGVEHGPRGGDELNRIRRGGNYGWPMLTYGSGYGLFDWTDDPDPDKIEQLDVATYVWVPSIAPSAMLLVKGEKFQAWKDDLLVASLKGARLFRLRLHQGRVIFAEPILVGARIRDITQTDQGDLLILLDRLPIVLRVERGLKLRDPDAAGSALCGGCHQLEASDRRAFSAPSLVGITDRTVAADPDFPYTDALRGMAGRWTPARIIEFVKHPQRIAFGSSHPNMDVANFRLRELFQRLETNRR